MKRLLDIKFLRLIFDFVLGLLNITVGVLVASQEPPTASTIYIEELSKNILTHQQIGIILSGIGLLLILVRMRPWRVWLLCTPLMYAAMSISIYLINIPNRPYWIIPFQIFTIIVITFILLLFESLHDEH